jgi:hypothetical protein
MHRRKTQIIKTWRSGSTDLFKKAAGSPGCKAAHGWTARAP